jgi:CDP-diacylglycerol--glycerol-3-phosphate 3-phosphatidyltransferase/cardiolipin synthase
MPLLLITFLPLNNITINGVLALTFGLLGLTDFFDGYLARLRGQETALGRLLDPIADKFLVYSTLIALVHTQKLFFYWAIIIIGREFFVMGLREIALFHGFHVPVSCRGKLKTVFQMIWLTFVILNPAQQLACKASFWNIAETLLLAITLFLTTYSALMYARDFGRQWQQS